MGECISYPRLPNMAPVKQAAQLYGLSPYYIRRLCKAGKIRFVNAGRGWLKSGQPCPVLRAGRPCPGGADPRSSQRPPGVPLMN